LPFEQADADDQRQQSEQEGAFERHQEMADRHRHAAGEQGDPAAGESVGDDPAQDRREIDERGVVAEDRGGERLAAEPLIMP
jgi:hypothetical protein